MPCASVVALRAGSELAEDVVRALAGIQDCLSRRRQPAALAGRRLAAYRVQVVRKACRHVTSYVAVASAAASVDAALAEAFGYVPAVLDFGDDRAAATAVAASAAAHQFGARSAPGISEHQSHGTSSDRSCGQMRVAPFARLSTNPAACDP